MAVRSSIAALIGFVAFIVGSAVIAAGRGADFGDISALLFGRVETASSQCILFGWGWLVAGLLSVAGFFAVFGGDDESAGRVRMPVGVPILFLLVAGGLLWLALGCQPIPAAPAETSPAIVEPAPPSPQPDIDDALDGAKPEAEPAAAPPPAVLEPAPTPRAKPPVLSAETAMAWPYEYPRIRGDEIVGSTAMDNAIAALFPMDDGDGAVRRMLCGKAWVAFTGSASEEGPADRNSTRARARARLVASRAESWLDRHSDCARPVVLGVDLGQHVPTDAVDPQATAYQRQVIVIGRDRASPDETVTPLAALAEMQAHYAAKRSGMLGSRAYRGQPAIFLVSDQ